MAITYLSPGTTDIRQIVFAVNQALERLQDPPTWVRPTGAPRWQLTSPLTLYVDPVNGSDSNDGLSTGTGHQLQKIQTAWNIFQQSIDQRDTTATIQLPKVTSTPITEAPTFTGAMPAGVATILIQGNTATPTNCQWQPASAIGVIDYHSVTFSGFGFGVPAGGSLISLSQFALGDLENCDFGANPGGVNVSLSQNSRVNLLSGCSISGNCGQFFQAADEATATTGGAIKVAGAPNVGIFANALFGGGVDLSGLSFTTTSTSTNTLAGQTFLSRWGGWVRGDSGVSWPASMTTGASTKGGFSDAGIGI